MSYFLITYNRRTGGRDLRPYGRNRAEALQARFATERKHRGDRDVEVVVLGADSEDALRKTHPRYFQTMSQQLTASRF